jgi:ribosome-associated protein YbcJ (S4-like RNA binding protein)
VTVDSGRLTTDLAATLAELVLDCLHREYPNHISHSMRDDSDMGPPHVLTPAFFGCFDWHSAVHGHWSLVRLLRSFPDADWSGRARSALNRSLTSDNLNEEHRYLSRSDRQGFERPYGIAWLLQLGGELREFAPFDEDARRWSDLLESLENLAVSRFCEWLPRLTHPVRSGVHSQTAFALALAHDWALTSHNDRFSELIRERSLTFFGDDRRGPLEYEPSGHDFLSPCLAEADLLRRLLPPTEFTEWLDAFLPGLSAAKLTPLQPATRSDGQLAHLDGLNLSRAWMLEGIQSSLASDDGRRRTLCDIANHHARVGMDQVNDQHYETAHWLGTFAVYLLTGRGLPDSAPDPQGPSGQSAQPLPDEPWIRLDHFLKRTGLVQTGGHAKCLIQGGEVIVGGQTETRRGRKLRSGDLVTLDGVEHQVEFT